MQEVARERREKGAKEGRCFSTEGTNLFGAQFLLNPSPDMRTEVEDAPNANDDRRNVMYDPSPIVGLRRWIKESPGV
jgi:hypothetical protein